MNFARRRLRLLSMCLVSLAAAGVTTGCYDGFCDGPGMRPVSVEVRDPRGEPAASGARVIVTTGSVIDTAWADPLPSRLFIAAGLDDPGVRWAKVRVEKPWYETVERLVGLNTGVCGDTGPARVRVDLTLLPNAPPLRSVFVARGILEFGGRTTSFQLYAAVDAAASVSDSVVWWSSDSTVVNVDGTGLVVRSQCRDTTARAYVGATSVADSTVSDSLYTWVFTPIDGCN